MGIWERLKQVLRPPVDSRKHSARGVSYRPLRPEERALRIVEVENDLRKSGGLRVAATYLVDVMERVRYLEAEREYLIARGGNGQRNKDTRVGGFTKTH